MKKRRIGLLLILLANFLLLADVIMPHHHHETSICFSFFSSHSTDHHHDQPVNNNDCTGCVLKHADILLNNVQRNLFKDIEIASFDFICSVLDSYIDEPFLSITGYLKINNSPPLKSIHLHWRQGLRAPPAA